MTNENTFYVGLTMAGAVSAGAYTAGVIDYLIETLDEWERRKKESVADTPMHNIQIPVVGGASAGGMTGIILASMVNEKFKHLKFAPENLLDEVPQNKLYHSWVDLVQEDMFSKMLENNDLNDGVKSLFNSNFIDEISRRLIKPPTGEYINRSYIAENLKVFVTLSNLKGFTYNLSFLADNKVQNNYFVERHNDYACFNLAEEYRGDGWMPLSFEKGINSRLAADAAMATGAFPIGLKSRKLTRETKYILHNKWLKISGANPQMKPLLNIEHQFVDGGMINNEPFDRVNDVLREIPGIRPATKEHYKDFNSTILMIDPFPATTSVFKKGDDIMSIAGKTLSAMLGQIRTKADDVVKTFQSDNSNQFMIAPSRFFPSYYKDSRDKVQGANAIACGFFNGFGGFFNKEFRIHDFFLGRANCEYFLRNHFTVPENYQNPIIEFGYKNVDRTKFYSETDNGKGLPIIPVFAEKTLSPYLPQFSCGGDWPKQDFKQMKNSYEGKFKNRVEEIISKTDLGKNWFQNFLIWLANRFFIRNKLTKAFFKMIKKDMKKHRLLIKK